MSRVPAIMATLGCNTAVATVEALLLSAHWRESTTVATVTLSLKGGSWLPEPAPTEFSALRGINVLHQLHCSPTTTSIELQLFAVRL